MKYIMILLLTIALYGCGMMHNMRPPIYMDEADNRRNCYDCKQEAIRAGVYDNPVLFRIEFQDCLRNKYGYIDE